MDRIDSANNGRYKAWKKLKTVHGRKKEKAFLVESHKLVVEALLSGMEMEALVIDREKMDRVLPLFIANMKERHQEKERFEEAFSKTDRMDLTSVLESEGGDYISEEGARWVKDHAVLLPHLLFEGLSSMENSDGILAVIRGSGEKSGLLGFKEPGLYLILDGLQDPGNVGTLLRTGEALGFNRVLSVDSCDPSNDKALRASMGASFRLEICRASQEDALVWKEETGIPWLGADMNGEDYRLFPKKDGPLALVVGSEGQGIRPSFMEALDWKIAIPMTPQVESLNAAISGAILMAYFSRV